MDLQLGDPLGLASAGLEEDGIAIIADGANAFTVSAGDITKLWIDQLIDLVNKTTGAVLASARLITTLANVAGAYTVSYSGADAAVTPGTHVVVPSGRYSLDHKSNANGGGGPGTPFRNEHLLSVDEMRARLTAIDADFYTAARLNSLTYNDMVYAIRLNDNASAIKQ